METGLSSVGSPLMYAGFFAAVLVMVLIDMFALNRAGNHKVSVREALGWSAVWFAIAMLFNAWLWWHIRGDVGSGLDEAARQALANQKALEFMTGYLIEKSLAVDNIFVFLLLFAILTLVMVLTRKLDWYGVMGNPPPSPAPSQES